MMYDRRTLKGSMMMPVASSAYVLSQGCTQIHRTPGNRNLSLFFSPSRWDLINTDTGLVTPGLAVVNGHRSCLGSLAVSGRV